MSSEVENNKYKPTDYLVGVLVAGIVLMAVEDRIAYGSLGLAVAMALLAGYWAGSTVIFGISMFMFGAMAVIGVGLMAMTVAYFHSDEFPPGERLDRGQAVMDGPWFMAAFLLIVLCIMVIILLQL